MLVDHGLDLCCLGRGVPVRRDGPVQGQAELLGVRRLVLDVCRPEIGAVAGQRNATTIFLLAAVLTDALPPDPLLALLLLLLLLLLLAPG